MTLRAVPALPADEVPEIPLEWSSTRAAWLRNVTAKGRSDLTLKSYAASIDRLIAWCAARDILDPADVRTADLEAFQIEALTRTTRTGRQAAPSSVVQLHRNLRVFFRWLAVTDGIANPLEGVGMPKAQTKPVDVMSVDDVRALLETCKGRGFADRRDAALIRMLVDSGARAAELVGMNVDDVDLDGRHLGNGIASVWVMGKGRKERRIPIGVKTAEAVGLYLRARARHRDAADPALWLVSTPHHRGRYSKEGVRHMLLTRAARAGVDHVHPHKFRHTAADMFLASDAVTEGDAMKRFGWETRVMVDHYGESAADRRAVEAFRKASPADRI